MIISIAWKNVWRNKLRSLIVIIAVLIGLLAGSFSVALMNGVTAQRTKSILNDECSHIQIHNPKFEANNEIEYLIKNPRKIIETLSETDKIKSFSGRLKVTAMASTSRANSSIMLLGINPEQEKQVTQIYKSVIDSTGNYFSKDKKNQVLIGEKLAKQLLLDKYIITEKSLFDFAEIFKEKELTKLKSLKNIKFRTKKKYLDTLKTLFDDKFVEENEFVLKRKAIFFKKRAKIRITFLNKTGQLIESRYRICGIYKTNNSIFDAMNVFIRKKDMIREAGFSENNFHEIACMLDNKDFADQIKTSLAPTLPENEIKTWKEINPELVMMDEYMIFYNYIIIALILAALSFGIINTMLMAIMDRTKELGMLSAIGMNRKKVFFMIMIETIFLTCTGAVAGLIINAGIMQYFAKNGLDLSASIGEGMEAVGYSSIIYPQMEADIYAGITLLVIFAAILSSIYPAIKAIKLNPAEAVRADV